MTTIITTTTRPNLETPFYEDVSFKFYVLENWILTNKIIVGNDLSDDGLVATKYLEFVDEAAAREWSTTDAVKENRKKKREYEQQNNITSISVMSE